MRDLLEQLDNPGQHWVKLEVLGDKKTLLPDPVGTLEACRELVADGFCVLCYSSDDPIMAADFVTPAAPASSPPAARSALVVALRIPRPCIIEQRQGSRARR